MRHSRASTPHNTVVWCNEESETGFPYDLVVSDANRKNKRFIGVKVTKTLDKPFFEVSAHAIENTVNVARLLFTGEIK